MELQIFSSCFLLTGNLGGIEHGHATKFRHDKTEKSIEYKSFEYNEHLKDQLEDQIDALKVILQHSEKEIHNLQRMLLSYPDLPCGNATMITGDS